MAIEQLERQPDQENKDPQIDNQGELKNDPRFDEQGKLNPQYLGAWVNEKTGAIQTRYSEKDNARVSVQADYIVPIDPITEAWLKSQKRAY